MQIHHVFHINAAHFLPCVGDAHKCTKLHGHTFRIEIHVRGPLDASLGWVRDFADIEAAFAPVHELLDHSCLNEIEGLANPTSENLARWIWARLEPRLPGLSRITVQETPEVGCTYEGRG